MKEKFIIANRIELHNGVIPHSKYRPDNKYIPFYIAEIKYRKEHNIKTDE